MNLGEPAKKLKAFVTKIHSKPVLPDEVPSEIFPMFFSQKDLGMLFLWGDDANKYRQCIDAYETELTKTFTISRKAIESIVRPGILKALDINKKFSSIGFEERLTNEVDEIKTYLSRNPTKWEVILEVSGLHADSLPLKVGNVEFIVVNEGAISDWNAIYKTQFSVESEESRERVETYCSTFNHKIQTELRGRVCARTEVDAVDNEGAREWAINNLRLTIDVVNFFSNVFNNSGTYIGLPGERFARASTVSIKFSKDTGSVFYVKDIVGPLEDFSLREARSKKATDIGFDRVCLLLGKDPRSDIDDRVIAGIRWAGRGMIESRAEEAFLWSAIALETLLLSDGERGAHGFRLGVKCAHLVAKSKENRRLVSQKIRKLYNLRNSIVHSGTAEVSDSELHLMRSYCSGVILRLLTTEPFTEMNSEKELEGWFEEQMLGGVE